MKHSKPLKEVNNRLSVYTKFKSLSPIFAEVLALEPAVANLESLAANRSPNDTEERHTQRVADAADKLGARTEKAVNRIAELQQSALSSIEARLAEKARLTPGADSSDICKALRELPSKKRYEVIREAAENGDHRVMAAIHGAHELVTGIPREHTENTIEIYTAKVAPEETEELLKLREFSEDIPAAIRIAESAVKSAYDPKFIAQIREAEKAAEEAQSHFKQSVA